MAISSVGIAIFKGSPSVSVEIMYPLEYVSHCPDFSFFGVMLYVRCVMHGGELGQYFTIGNAYFNSLSIIGERDDDPFSVGGDRNMSPVHGE